MPHINPVINRRNQRSRAFAPDPDAPGRDCDIPGCGQQAGFRAPKSRTTLNEYWWFCLDHVRAYNGSWDFYKGMSPGQIEEQIRADTYWQRPSWKLGHVGAGGLDEDAIRDPLGVLAAGRAAGKAGRRGARVVDERRRPDAPSELREPLDALGLVWPVSLAELKIRYRDLAKLHHPDANGGDRLAEERLKTINIAYSALRRHLTVPDHATASAAPYADAR